MTPMTAAAQARLLDEAQDRRSATAPRRRRRRRRGSPRADPAGSDRPGSSAEAFSRTRPMMRSRRRDQVGKRSSQCRSRPAERVEVDLVAHGSAEGGRGEDAHGLETAHAARAPWPPRRRPRPRSPWRRRRRGRRRAPTTSRRLIAGCPRRRPAPSAGRRRERARTRRRHAREIVVARAPRGRAPGAPPWCVGLPGPPRPSRVEQRQVRADVHVVVLDVEAAAQAARAPWRRDRARRRSTGSRRGRGRRERAAPSPPAARRAPRS